MDGEVGDSLCDGLHFKRLVVHEPVVLRLHSGPLHQHLGVGSQAGEGERAVLVDLDDLLDGGWLHEGGGDALLDGEHHALGGNHSDGCRAELDGLDRIFDLLTNLSDKFLEQIWQQNLHFETIETVCLAPDARLTCPILQIGWPEYN